MEVLHRVHRKDPQTSARFSRRVSQKARDYQWPIPKKYPPVEEQVLSPIADRSPKLLKTDMSLSTVLEAHK